MKRKKHKQVRKLAAAALALSVAMSTPVYAADPVTNTNTTTNTTNTTTNTTSDLVLTFSDVSAQHWAIKHITKLASLGIIQGYEKREYRPENSVQQQEVIVMALRMMGLESEALKSKAETVLPFGVDPFFKPYVAYAIDRGLIDLKEEADAGAAAKTSWGRNEATREWVAKLVIRAIGKQDMARQLSTVASTFGDVKDMSAWANGYVNAAVQLKIVQGMDGNTFQPKGNVTRAQMATFLSRADKELTSRSSRVSTGYMMGLTDRKITVMNAQGQTSDYTITSDTVVYNAKDDSRIPLSSIKLTNEVYIIQNQGNALYIELTNDQQKLETYEGTLNKVYLDQMVVSLQQNNQDNLYNLAQNVAVTDKDGRGLSLGSIEPGSVIALQRNTLLKDQKITQIIVKQVPVSKSAEGTVLSINKDQNQITFVEKTSGQNEVYTVKGGASVTMQDGTSADISKLRVGDSVSYEIKSNALTAVKIIKQADFNQTIQGKMVSLSDDRQIITINKNGSGALEAYYIANNATVTIEGMSNASLYDLEVGDELKLELVNNKVVNTSITSRSVKQYEYASILSYDPDTMILTVTTNDGSPNAFKMTDTTNIRVSDTTLQLRNFDSMFTKGKKVDMKVSKDRIVQIQLTQKVEGTVTQINATAGELTMRTASGQSLTFRVSTGIPVEVQDKSNATLSDLKVGDSINVSLGIGTQDVITYISTKKVGVYKTLITNSSTRQVTVKDDTGALMTFNVDSNDKIVNPGKTSHAFEDIGLDEYVKVSFKGAQLDQLVLLNTLRGKVTSVDAALGSITVQDFQGGIQVQPVGSQFTIKQNGQVSAALTSIKPNDRVEIIKDANDKVIIQVATSSKRVISSYDNVLNQLLLKPTAAGDKTTFNFFAKAYLHKGNVQVAANGFAENDEVTIYVLDDKIIEIEKN